MTQTLDIGGRRIGDGQPCYIVAEISGNHAQEYERALAILHAAHAAGADAIKMQAYTADTITLDHDGPEFRIPAGNSWERYGTLHRLYRDAYTPWDWFEPLFAEARRLGMQPFCSVFDESSVAHLQALDAPAYKIAAPEITDVPLLRHVAATGRPVILSTGLADRDDLQLAVDTLRAAGCHDIVLLKCTSEYPAPIEQANLRTIGALRDDFGCLAGLSDHTLGIVSPIAAVSVGASVIEKHLTLDENDTVDSFFSLRPDDFRAMVEAVRAAEAALGRVDYAMQGLESGTANGRRSLYVAAPVKAGEPLSPANVRSVRPSGGLHPKHWDQVMSSVAARDLAFGDALSLDDLAQAVTSDAAPGTAPAGAAGAATAPSRSERALLELLVDAGARRATLDGLTYRFMDDDTLDSFSRIALCLEIESAFGVTLSSDTLLDPVGGSIAGIAALMDGRALTARAA